MSNYLTKRELNIITSYCKSKCLYFANNHNKTILQYNRGLYKGYIYGAKLIQYHSKKNISVSVSQLYQIIKKEKIEVKSDSRTRSSDFSSGLETSLYDLMNYISSVKY